jgi:(1->4)-alpha-D-glucan 1-alpha-D-glucosylmutase
MPRAVPLATYRLQLTPEFGFDAAADRVPYLKALGVTHLYSSPFMKSRRGSTHGYDVVDHNKFDAELGGEAGFERLSAALAKADLGLILDFVPNHVGVGHADNEWWLDVLEWGRGSPYAAHFDIDWEAQNGRLLLPILGKPYGEALANGEIELRYASRDGSFSAWYFGHRLPICPVFYDEILRTMLAAAKVESEAASRLADIAARCAATDSPDRAQADALKSALRDSAGAADIIARGISAYRASEENASGLAALERLLARQHYRLAHWRLAASELNYRRFFDIVELAGIRVENEETFGAVHRLAARLIATGRIDGLRLDHIDGLYDPQQYCIRLRALIEANRPRPPQQSGPFYVLVEKILAEDETPPPFAGVAGTTGYEVVNLLTRVLVDGAGLTRLKSLAEDFTGKPHDFSQTVENSKNKVLDTMLGSEFNALARLIARIAGQDARTRAYAPARLAAALRQYAIHFPIYRTYVTAEGCSPQDRKTIADTIAAARKDWAGEDAAIFDFLRDALTLDLAADPRSPYRAEDVCRFALKVQQFTGPLTAKSLEDTALYRDVRLIALNEVGGDPSLPALTAAQFHPRMAESATHHPHAMSATATHDTKRGEDARARIAALAELAADWEVNVRRWAKLNAAIRDRSQPRAPSATHEYLLYQTLLGAWPLEGVAEDFVERIKAYLTKAAREGKTETSWLEPDAAYEAALLQFAEAILRSDAFVQDFDAFARRAALIGALNSLSQLALKATVPGVPDFYQGSEFWELSLVDPDNRRPVDFPARERALAALGAAPDWPALAADWHSGRIKLALTRCLLRLRSELPHVFLDGAYVPLDVGGRDSDHVLAFARAHGEDAVIVAVGRHFAGVTGGGRNWAPGAQWETTLSLGAFSGITDVLRPGRRIAGGTVALAELFEGIPVALLRAQRSA